MNISPWRCDALIVTQDGVQAIRLPGLTSEEVTRRTAAFLRALQGDAPADPELPFTEALKARARSLAERDEVLQSTTEWLWDVIADPVLTALGASQVSPPGPPMRLWWCPTGLLTLLPLHGAGYHQARDGRTVLDRAVSSYTPTLRALGEARKPRPVAPSDAGRLLFVGVPEAPDQLQMAEDVAREQDFLAGHFPGGLTVLSGPEATVAAVQAAMPGHRWVHLSCHGYQDLRDPSAALPGTVRRDLDDHPPQRRPLLRRAGLPVSVPHRGRRGRPAGRGHHAGRSAQLYRLPARRGDPVVG